MDSKSTKHIIFLISSVLLLSFNSNTSAVVQLIPMQQIGEDSTGDGLSLGYDILSAYAASFDGLLMLTVVYEEVGDWGLFSNTTLRNSNGDLHLFMVYATPDFSSISVVDATSLEDDALNTNDVSYFSYEELWRVNSNSTELTFFVDWADIGGEGPVDLVFWTGVARDNPDKLPNTGYLTFDGVNTVDKIGYLDDPAITTTTSINGPTSETDPAITTSQPLLTTITVTENNDSLVTTSNQTETTDTEAVIQITDIIPLSNTFVLGLIVVYMGYRKIRR